jgi:hypothetical protein
MLGEQGEGGRMGRPEDAEVAAVQGSDVHRAESLGNSDDKGISCAKGKVGVSLDRVRCANGVGDSNLDQFLLAGLQNVTSAKPVTVIKVG